MKSNKKTKYKIERYYCEREKKRESETNRQKERLRSKKDDEGASN